MAEESDEKPRPAASHTLGQPLDALSIAEFDERIALLRAEISRLEAAREKNWRPTRRRRRFLKNERPSKSLRSLVCIHCRAIRAGTIPVTIILFPST